MKRRLRQLGIILAILAGLLVLAVISGLVPVAASSGHWRITAWFLNFAMRRAVEVRALGVTVPELEDRALVLKGAGHFEHGCRPCHGAPGEAQPLIPHQMTPHPPDLAEAVPNWDPEDLFYIVKHGVKFTGMPAWPALDRDDEIWAMVAFLQRYPDLDLEGYRRLVHGEAVAEVPPDPLEDPATRSARETCSRCHGDDGRGRGEGAFPVLAGQRVTYLLGSLEAFAEGRRHSGVMEPVAAALPPEVRRELARHYGMMPRRRAPIDLTTDPGQLDRGEAIAERGIPRQKVPSCVDCHGPGQEPRNEAYPLLAGQYADYLALQLRLFREGIRGGTPYADIMETVAAHQLTEAQIADVAAWYASLEPEPE